MEYNFSMSCPPEVSSSLISILSIIMEEALVRKIIVGRWDATTFEVDYLQGTVQPSLLLESSNIHAILDQHIFFMLIELV